jgi:hypothetical protein
MPPQARSVTHVKIALLEAHKPFLGCSFSSRVFGQPLQLWSLNCTCKEGAEMFIFLNLTLHSFGPENFVPLVQSRKFKKGLIEENESYKMVYYT